MNRNTKGDISPSYIKLKKKYELELKIIITWRYLYEII